MTAGGSRPLRRLALLIAALAIFLGFCALGIWQVQRLSWKTDLIARVEARLAAAPVPAPGPADWPDLLPTDEYRRIAVTGRYAEGRDTLVKAVTVRGPGFWVMTPLATPQGWTVLVNRGFVPDTARAEADRILPSGPVQVTGLMRLSQPGGGFLRSNQPQAGRWYSRDTAAIAATQGLRDAAPYFIDAEARADDRLPIGGLTVVSFRNNHLGYALTWFALAALWAGWLGWLWRRGPAPEDDPEDDQR